MNVILFGHLYVILFGNLYWLYYIINVIVTHLPSPVGLIYLGSFWLEINGWEEIDLGYVLIGEKWRRWEQNHPQVNKWGKDVYL
jgi:hypothetical protein